LPGVSGKLTPGNHSFLRTVPLRSFSGCNFGREFQSLRQIGLRFFGLPQRFPGLGTHPIKPAVLGSQADRLIDVRHLLLVPSERIASIRPQNPAFGAFGSQFDRARCTSFEIFELLQLFIDLGPNGLQLVGIDPNPIE
jgi:hypothetical protein